MDLPTNGWNLDNPRKVKEGDGQIDPEAMPYLADAKAWNNYQDETVMQCEELMRAWIAEMRENGYWMASPKHRTYRFNQLFELLYKRPYDPKTDSWCTAKCSKVFNYYSSTVRNNSWDKVKERPLSKKKSYVISTKLDNVPPYSLKLRIPWLIEHGMEISGKTMKVPDPLPAGHSRNACTEKNMKKRREQAQRAYTEYQRRRNAASGNSQE